MLYKFNITHIIIIRHLNQKTLLIENILIQIYQNIREILSLPSPFCHSHTPLCHSHESGNPLIVIARMIFTLIEYHPWQSRSTFSINEKPITNNFFFKKEGFYKTLSNINLCVFINQNGQISNWDVGEVFKISN